MNLALSQRRRILVIDDNDAIHSDFRKILNRGLGTTAADMADDEAVLFGETAPATPSPEFVIDAALQGEEGRVKVAAALKEGDPYLLAFVDMRMPPGWDGVQTIAKLWELDAELHVVICTAYSDYSWEQIVHRLGSTDRMLILKKPFDELEVCQLATALTAKRIVTEQAKLKLAELEQLVQTRTFELKQRSLVDKLTGLPNRELLIDRLTQLLRGVDREPDRKFALLFLDFDRFKVVNDSLGHAVGDLLLIEIARRLASATRDGDTVAQGSTAARLGGDEFVVLLNGLSQYHDAVRVTERLLATLSEPYALNGRTVHATASIGITTSAVGYTSPEAMIRDADTAMYRAKAAGKARYVVFDQQMHLEAVTRLSLENELRDAIGSGQLVVHYQPIISLRTNRIAGVEALVRWRHPERGLIPPLDFIPLAEEIGIIVPLGYEVLTTACRQLADWRQRLPGLAALTMSVNLSRRQVAAADLVDQVARIVAAAGIRPTDLVLEITETAIMEDADAAVRVLEELGRMGIELHMDDFGSGHSSLSCLHRFPIRGLKIDRSFVSCVRERADYAAVVKAVISLTHNLNMQFVAEGVETAEQVSKLREMGCDRVQGYYFAKAMDAGATEAFLTSYGAADRDRERAAAATGDRRIAG